MTLPVELDRSSVLADAQLVAFGVRHEDPARAELLVAFDPPGSEGFEACRFGLDVWVVDVEMEPVLYKLGFVDALEDDLHSRVRVRWHDGGILANGSTAFVAERCEIELDHPIEFGDVEDECDG